MIDNGKSNYRQFRRTFTCSKSGPFAFSGLRRLSLFLISRLYSAKSTFVSIDGRACYMYGSSISTDKKNHFKCLFDLQVCPHNVILPLLW